MLNTIVFHFLVLKRQFFKSFKLQTILIFQLQGLQGMNVPIYTTQNTTIGTNLHLHITKIINAIHNGISISGYSENNFLTFSL